MNKNLISKRNVNWHEAAACAMQIELRDYSHLLDFYTEYVLSKNSYRIDLLIIHKIPDTPIPKNIAKRFLREEKPVHPAEYQPVLPKFPLS